MTNQPLCSAALISIFKSKIRILIISRCKIRFSLKDGRCLDVVGKATGGARDRATVIEFAKKNAVTDARKSIFQRLAIIVLAEGKVAVHFLDAPIEEWEEEKPKEPTESPFQEGPEDRLIIDV